MSTNPGSAEEQPQTPVKNENNAAEEPQSAKKKSEKFTNKEVDALRNEVYRRRGQLFTPNKQDIRDNAWKHIRKEINTAGQKGRTVRQCQNKWNNYKRKLRTNIRETKDHSQLQSIFDETDMKLVNYLKLDQEIAKDVGHDSTDDPDSGSTSFDESYEDVPPSPLVTSTLTPNPDVPVISDDTVHSTAIDEPEQQSLDLETKLDQLFQQQQCTNSIMTNIRDKISESVDLQKEMLKLLKDIMSSQKKANDYCGVYEVTLKRQDVEQSVGENQLEEGNE